MSSMLTLRFSNPKRKASALSAALTDSSPLSSSVLTREWNDLAERTGATPYVRPEWVAAWWRAFGAGELRILTLRRKGRLVGLLPVAQRHGCVSSLTNYHTPQSDLLAEDAGVAYDLAQRLFTGHPRRVCLAGLPALGGGINACQRAAREAGYRIWVHPYQTSPYLRIEGSWERYEARLGSSSSRAAGLRRSLRRLNRRGQVSLEIVSSGEGLVAALQSAFAIEALSWKTARHTAIQSHPKTMQFYTNIARWAESRGSLRLFFLCLDRQPLAMLYALEEQGVCHLLKSGYDARYRQFSPGSLLIRSVVERCFAKGLRTVEFHGDAEPYKLQWASETRRLKRFDAFSPSLAGRLSFTAHVHARQAAKYLLHSVGRRRRCIHEHVHIKS
ncbi:MAG: GNAT family N-acetyltransferase [Gammaproteobacteria bacterium]